MEQWMLFFCIVCKPNRIWIVWISKSCCQISMHFDSFVGYYERFQETEPNISLQSTWNIPFIQQIWLNVKNIRKKVPMRLFVRFSCSIINRKMTGLYQKMLECISNRVHFEKNKFLKQNCWFNLIGMNWIVRIFEDRCKTRSIAYIYSFGIHLSHTFSQFSHKCCQLWKMKNKKLLKLRSTFFHEFHTYTNLETTIHSPHS